MIVGEEEEEEEEEEEMDKMLRMQIIERNEKRADDYRGPGQIEAKQATVPIARSIASREASIDSIPFHSIPFDSIRFDSIRSDSIRFD
jgi:hypothetical protein